MNLFFRYVAYTAKNALFELAKGVGVFFAFFAWVVAALFTISTVLGFVLWTITFGEIAHQQSTPFGFVDLVFCGFLFFVMLYVYCACVVSVIGIVKKHVLAYRKFKDNPGFGCDQGETYR